MARGGRLKSGLIIPGSVASVKKPAFRCRVIVDDEGTLCGAAFTEEHAGEYQRHVTACARKHDAEIRQASKRVRMPGIFGPDAGDVEAERWVRRNARAIIEGTKSYAGKRRRHG